MTHGSLFSGIGGFDLAAKQAGYTNIFQVEKDPWCLKILKKNFPDVRRYQDITQFDGKPYENKIDLLTGGFPCQPFSLAGKRRGMQDNRYLWPEMLRVIGEIKPSIVIGENVAGIVSLALDQVLIDLENIGYTTETFVIPAGAINAPHRRDRVWIIAYTKTFQNIYARRIATFKNQTKSKNTKNVVLSDTLSPRLSQCQPSTIGGKKRRHVRRAYAGGNYWESKPGVGRVADGISNRLDRIKGLGNAIVPQLTIELISKISLKTNPIKRSLL